MSDAKTRLLKALGRAYACGAQIGYPYPQECAGLFEGINLFRREVDTYANEFIARVCIYEGEGDTTEWAEFKACDDFQGWVRRDFAAEWAARNRGNEK